MYSEIFNIPPLVIAIAQGLLTLAMILAGWRIWRGPTTADRVVALDLMAALIMAHFIVMVFVTGFISYLDVAAVIAVISFIATIAFARYLEDPKSPL